MKTREERWRYVLENLELILAVVAIGFNLVWNLIGTIPNTTLPFTIPPEQLLLLTVLLLATGILRHNYIQTSADAKIITSQQIIDRLDRLDEVLWRIPVKGIEGIPEQISPRDWLDEQCNKIPDNSYRSHEILILQTFFAEKDLIGATAITALKRGAKMKVLLAKPESAVAKIRSFDLYRNENFALDSGIPKFNEFYDSLQTKDKENIEIRYYETIPPFSLYAVGNLILAGRYWYKKSTGDGYTEVIRKDSAHGLQVITAFNELWEECVDTSLPKYPFLSRR